MSQRHDVTPGDYGTYTYTIQSPSGPRRLTIPAQADHGAMLAEAAARDARRVARLRAVRFARMVNALRRP
jgi:hypothetical protein